MRDKTLIVNDHICLRDRVAMPESPKKGMWSRTEILVSDGDVIRSPYGKSSFAPGSNVSVYHNIVPIGGVQYTMEKVYGVKGSVFTTPTLYDLNGIGIANSAAPSETYLTPDGYKTIIYRPGNVVQLVGCGITGSGDNDISMYEPTYRENSLNMTRVNEKGITITGTMIPFRCTTEALSNIDSKKYFGKKNVGNGYTAYYLKRLESDIVIKHIYKVSADDETEVSLQESDIFDNSTGNNLVESFSEAIIQFSKKDIKEWFAMLEQSDRARINTIALFSGEYVLDSGNGDYRDVTLYSKCGITNEQMTLSKNLNIIYRTYGA